MSLAVNDPKLEPTLNTIGSILVTISGTQSTGDRRKEAEGVLKKAELNAFGVTVIRLLEVLVSKHNHVTDQIRQMAGVVARRIIGDARSEQKKYELAQRWKGTPQNQREFIKTAAMQVMSNESRIVRQTGATIVAKIAIIESLQSWKIMPQIIDKLGNVAWHDTMFTVLIDLVDEDSTHDTIKSQILPILTAMNNALQSTNNQARLAAVKCLLHCVANNLLEEVMSQPQQAQGVMSMVFKCCSQQTNMDLQSTAFQILVTICENYYDYIGEYFQQIFQKTGQIINDAIEDEPTYGDVGKFAIEFWSSCADVELEVMEKLEGYSDNNSNNNNIADNELPPKYHKFVEKASASFLSLYMKALCTQNLDDYDSQEYSIRQASAVSLELFAKILKDKIINNQAIQSFISKNFTNKSWNIREALITCVGAICSGPSPKALEQFLSAIVTNDKNPQNCLLFFIAQSLKDENNHVKTTSAYAFGRICEKCPNVMDKFPLQSIITELGNLLLKGTDKQSQHACWSLSNLLQYWYEKKKITIQPDLLQKLIGALLTRGIQNSNGIITPACFEVIISIIDVLPGKETQFLLTVFKEILNRLQKNCGQKSKEWVVAGCFSSIGICIDKLTFQWREQYKKTDDIPVNFLSQEYVNIIMNAVTSIDKVGNDVAYQEALNAIASLAGALNENIYPYIKSPEIQNVLIIALQSDASNVNLIQTSAHQMGEIFRRMEKHIIQNPKEIKNFSDKILHILMQHCQNHSLPIEIKQIMIQSMTDIASAFQKWGTYYFQRIVPESLEYGSIDSEDKSDFWYVEQINNIRESVVDMLDTALICYQEADTSDEFMKFGKQLFNFFNVIIANGEHNSDSLLKKIFQLIENMSTTGDSLLLMLKNDTSLKLFQLSQHRPNDVQQAAHAANKVLRRQQ